MIFPFKWPLDGRKFFQPSRLEYSFCAIDLVHDTVNVRKASSASGIFVLAVTSPGFFCLLYFFKEYGFAMVGKIFFNIVTGVIKAITDQVLHGCPFFLMEIG